MDISAADVMKLRKATGAGMMDCKNALIEAEGNFDRGVEIIRERGKAIANKRADREASEGVVLAKVEGKKGGIIALNCETDFVAKNTGFIELANGFLMAGLASGAKNLEELKAIVIDGRTIEAQIVEQTGIIGEKLELNYFDVIEAESLVSYIHPGNKLATVIGFNKAEVSVDVAKDVAMQAAAMCPVAVDKDDVPASVAEKELQIAKEKFRLEGKPENMLDKIAQGALQKFYKESTLLNQEFIKDNKHSVREYLESNDKGLTVTSFLRYTINV